MLRSKGSNLKASHDQQLCKNWVSRSVNYLGVVKVSFPGPLKVFYGYSRHFDKKFKVVCSSSGTKDLVTSWEPVVWHFWSFFITGIPFS